MEGESGRRGGGRRGRRGGGGKVRRALKRMERGRIETRQATMVRKGETNMRRHASIHQHRSLRVGRREIGRKRALTFFREHHFGQHLRTWRMCGVQQASRIVIRFRTSISIHIQCRRSSRHQTAAIMQRRTRFQSLVRSSGTGRLSLRRSASCATSILDLQIS